MAAVPRQSVPGLASVTLLVLSFTAALHAQFGSNGQEWRSYGGDLGHTRYAPLSEIDASNFARLEVAWRFKTDNLGPRPEYVFQSTPLVVDGML